MADDSDLCSDYYDDDEDDESDQLYQVDSGNDYLGEDTQPEASSSRKQEWTVIDQCTLAKLQNGALEAVSGIMGCSRSTARKLLVHFRWDKESLMCTVADKGQEVVYRAAGVTSAVELEDPSASMAEVDCGSCLCSVARNECTSMECGHIFCNSCWQQYFDVQISDGNSRRLRCMAFRCGAICDEGKVGELLPDSSPALKRYQQALLESYIEDNQNVRWCPSAPHCGRAIQVDGDHYCEPQCCCGLMFCFKCGDLPHSPATCEMFQIWKQKSQDDSETKNWLCAHTKPCPKCKNPVEKNGGCNLVVCRCGQAFCWLCGSATGTDHTWTRISGHECGRWKDDMDKKVDEASRNHKRYMHYFERWKGHMDSLAKEDELRADVLTSVENLENADNELNDYSWITFGLDQVLVARRILSSSYVFAFFMFGNDMFKSEISEERNLANKELFEDQQQMLEAELERLSHLLEDAQKPANKSMQLRMLVINSKDSIHRRIVNLYNTLENDILSQLTQSASSIAPYTGK
ncbi:unnamed protein product [Ostreobium quekettii]|uniref:RBR-type E3 ubiquitin transferase n=1 Tax=Ostreobium quekettii TaxID=121088 RepID=A0A8S1J7K5_9CHLO|nr:unnamed protein product [Ostreobium quekettii]